VREEISLEHGITIGIALSPIGVLYAVFSVYQWVQSGFTELPVLTGDIIAFTVIVLGIQTVFQSFLLSMLGSQSET
jgi:hypothetical protein